MNEPTNERMNIVQMLGGIVDDTHAFQPHHFFDRTWAIFIVLAHKSEQSIHNTANVTQMLF